MTPSDREWLKAMLADTEDAAVAAACHRALWILIPIGVWRLLSDEQRDEIGPLSERGALRWCRDQASMSIGGSTKSASS